jgi:hypothetical protein
MCKATALALAGDIDCSQDFYDQAFRSDPVSAARYGQTARPMLGPPDARAVHLSGLFAHLYAADWQHYAATIKTATAYFADTEHAPGAIDLAFPLLYLPVSNAHKSACHRAVTRDLEPLAVVPWAAGE